MSEDWDDAAARTLSEKKPLVTWPPAVGDRVHFNSGCPHTSWTAEVRAVVDDRVVVLWRTVPANGWSSYDVMRRCSFDVFKVRRGPLPRALTRPLP